MNAQPSEFKPYVHIYSTNVAHELTNAAEKIHAHKKKRRRRRII